MTSTRRRFVAASAMGVLVAVGQRLLGAQEVDSSTAFRRQVGPIDWYCERRGRGPTVVLIPSGEGDCGSFEKVATLLSVEFTVLTFDMPGFSRSSDPPNFENYSMSQAASEVAALVRTLELGPATFYGCSSGGQVALRLAAEHSGLVRRAVVHEVAPGLSVRQPGRAVVHEVAPGPPAGSGQSQPAPPAPATEAETVQLWKNVFRNGMNENAAAWDALGEEYHVRLERNYLTWVSRYFSVPDMRMPTPEELQRRPVTWTIGALTEAGVFFNNVEAAHAGGIKIGLLMCKHFPQVSIPQALADHIAAAARA